MNKTLSALIIGLSALGAASSAAARHNDDFVDTARVTSVTPIYETVTVNHPVEECWSERMVHPGRGHRHDGGGALVGGIIGGLLGHQIGEGSGKTAATIGGTLLGASVGNDLGHHRGHRPFVTRERHCELVDRYSSEEQLAGYRVEYRYKGRTFVTRTREHPGRRIRVGVDVAPLAERDDYSGYRY